MRVGNCNCNWISTTTTGLTGSNVRVNRNIRQQHNIPLMKMMMMKPSTTIYRCYVMLRNVIKIINVFALGNAFTYLKHFHKPSTMNTNTKRNNVYINKRIIDNMSNVALSIHNDNTNKLNYVKLLKAFNIINNILEASITKHNIKTKAKPVEWYFNMWKYPKRVVLSLLKEDSEFKDDIKTKIEEYDKGINVVETQIAIINNNIKTCNTCGINIDNLDNIDDDIDLLDDDLNGDEYLDYLQTTENDIITRITEHKEVNERKCVELQHEIELLTNEIAQLTINNDV